MYKLLLVSDRENVLEAFDRVNNWEFNGFKKPHIRHDLEGAKESLQHHHADGIAIALSPEATKEVTDYLREAYPILPIFEAGTTPDEVSKYLGELNQLLNWLRLDFSSDTFDDNIMMIRARRHFFRKLVNGMSITKEELRRALTLRRSRMDPNKPVVLMNLEQPALADGRLEGRWQDEDHLLERALFQSFGGDAEGYHILPLVPSSGKIYVLAGALRDQEQSEDMIGILDERVRDGLEHAEEFQGLQLRVTGVEVLPSLFALCSDFNG